MAKIGVIGAMDIEVEQLKGDLVGREDQRWMGMDVSEGTLEGVPACVVCCGVGKVNAAVCAHALIEHFGADMIINTGVAGSLDERLGIGDIVVSTDAVHHDMDVRALGFAPGEVPGMDTSVFLADETLRQIAMRAVGEAVTDVRVFEGRIASGDQFVGSAEQKDRIVSQFGALCTEMEGAAIAHACYLAHVPFVIIRSISDNADGSADVDYPTFKALSAKRSAAAVRLMACRLTGEIA